MKVMNITVNNMRDLTKEIKQILNNFALPAVNTKDGISEGFIRDTDGKFNKIAIEINELVKQQANK